MMHTDKEFPVSPCKECLDLHKKSKILSAIEKEEWELINTSTYSLHKIVRIHYVQLTCVLHKLAACV